MAITIESTPNSFEPVYTIDGHNLSFVLSSTSSSLCSMKYVGDVYVENQYVTTIKNSPNLINGNCVMQFNRIIENYISNPKWTGPNFQIATASFVEYSVIFGEETDGTYNCTGTDFTTTYGPSFSGKAFNGTIQYEEINFDLTDYSVGAIANATASFLTNCPDELDIADGEHSFLSYISSSAVVTVGPPTYASHALQVVVTNNLGATRTFYVLNEVNSPAYTIYMIGVGPADINSYPPQNIVLEDNGSIITTDLIDCNTVTYKVRIADYIEVS